MLFVRENTLERKQPAVNKFQKQSLVRILRHSRDAMGNKWEWSCEFKLVETANERQLLVIMFSAVEGHFNIIHRAMSTEKFRFLTSLLEISNYHLS
jgi:hypothetical protein